MHEAFHSQVHSFKDFTRLVWSLLDVELLISEKSHKIC